MKYLAFYHNDEVTTLVAREVIFPDDENYIEITEAEFITLQNTLSDFTKIIKVKRNKIVIEERFNEEELAKILKEREKEKQINRAKKLTELTDKFELPSYRKFFMDNEWDEFINWRESLHDFEYQLTDQIPELPEFIKNKFLIDL